MSSIRKRGKTYQIRVSCGYNFEKKQIVKSMTYKPKSGMTERQILKELERRAILFEEECKTEYNENMKLCDFLAKWFSDYAEKQLKAKSIARYRALLPRINRYLGHIRINKLKPCHFVEFYNKLSQSGMREDFKFRAKSNFEELIKKHGFNKKALACAAGVSEFVINSCIRQKNISRRTAAKILNILPDSLIKSETKTYLNPKTVQQYHRFLSSVLNTAVEWQFISCNPCKKVKPPKAERREAKYLDDVQIVTLINALKKEPLKYKTMIMLFLCSGMRRGELCGLEWRDIDFKNNSVNISKSSLYLPNKGIYDDSLKNKYSERVIYLPHVVIKLLEEYSRQTSSGSEDKIFKGLNGLPIHPDSVTGWFSKFITRNNLPKISIHSLRHTNASLLIAGGADIKTVANRLGHSSAATTGNIYTHAIKSADLHISKKLNVFFTKNIMDK